MSRTPEDDRKIFRRDTSKLLETNLRKGIDFSIVIWYNNIVKGQDV